MTVCQVGIAAAATKVQNRRRMAWTWREDGSAALDLEITRKKLSYRAFGEAMGVSGSLVSRWCNGSRTPDADQLAAACRTLGASADTLLGLQPLSQREDEIRSGLEVLRDQVEALTDRLGGRRR